MTKDVISYAFYRHSRSDYESERCGVARGKFFINYLPTLIRANLSVYPDWTTRIYHDETSLEFPYFEVLKKFEEKGLIELRYSGVAETLCGSMLWRMRPMFDPSVRRFLCRDLDSLCTPRERAGVYRWTNSGIPLMGIQDSPSHSSCKLMGGMVGFDTDQLKPWSTTEKFEEAAKNLGFDLNLKGADQKVLMTLFGRQLKLKNGFHLETSKTMGGGSDPRDSCDGSARHVGGAFFAKPVRDFYDSKGYTDQRILQAEKDVGWSDA